MRHQCLADPKATGPEIRKINNALPQNRVNLGFFTSPWKGKASPKHIYILYIDRPQFATLLLPLNSTGFYLMETPQGKA
jgi:hypothetical protein